MNDTIIFVDVGFLNKLSKHFGDGKYLKFNQESFFKNIAKNQNLCLKKIYYYTAPPFQSNNPDYLEIKMKKGYDKFIFKLKSNNLFIVREGRVQKLVNSKGDAEFHQKGVDNLVTWDLARTKIKYPEIEKIILITSDTDFCPIIKELKEELDVILVTYHERKRNSKFSVSNHLIDSCDEVFQITKQDMIDNLLKGEKN